MRKVAKNNNFLIKLILNSSFDTKKIFMRKVIGLDVVLLTASRGQYKIQSYHKGRRKSSLVNKKLWLSDAMLAPHTADGLWTVPR